jgi:NADPH-dependent 2,4-dienoyl-CoA reductase/sulfur reductase-like enzyme
LLKSHEIAVFDSKTEHHYQPAYTMVGGGVIGTAAQTKKREGYYVVRDQSSMFMPGVNWVRQNIETFDPENNTLGLMDGQRCTYEYLIVSPGCELRWDMIPGAEQAVQDPNTPVGSIYTLSGAYKMSNLREGFRGGKAIFTLPTMPIKCGGGPQKIMYLSEETFRRNGVRDETNIHWYTTVGNMFPNCLKFADALEPIAKSKNIDLHYKQ